MSRPFNQHLIQSPARISDDKRWRNDYSAPAFPSLPRSGLYQLSPQHQHPLGSQALQ